MMDTIPRLIRLQSRASDKQLYVYTIVRFEFVCDWRNQFEMTICPSEDLVRMIV